VTGVEVGGGGTGSEGVDKAAGTAFSFFCLAVLADSNAALRKASDIDGARLLAANGASRPVTAPFEDADEYDASAAAVCPITGGFAGAVV
jgi:hypothetical protein